MCADMIYVYICMCVCICTSMRLYTCVCVCVCIFAHRLWVLVLVLQRMDGVMHAHVEKPPPEDRGPGQPENEHSNLPQSISVFFHLSQGRIEELTSLLSELSGTPLTMKMTSKWLGLEPQSKEIPHDSQTKKWIDVLSEDPEDHPAGFISIIERHNARLKKAHLLHEATRDII